LSLYLLSHFFNLEIGSAASLSGCFTYTIRVKIY